MAQRKDTSGVRSDDYPAFLAYVHSVAAYYHDVNTLRHALNIMKIAQSAYDEAYNWDLAAVRIFAGGAGQMEADSLLTEGPDQDATITRQYEQRQRQLPNVFSVQEELDGEVIDAQEAVRRRLQESVQIQRLLKKYRVMRPSVEDAFLLALDYIEQDADAGLGLDIARKLQHGTLTREEMARYLRRHVVTRSCFARCAGACFSRVDGCSRSRADTNIFAGKERFVHEQRLAEAMLKTLCTMRTPSDFWVEHVFNRNRGDVDVTHRHHMTSSYLIDISHLFDVFDSLDMDYAFHRLDADLKNVIEKGATWTVPSAFDLDSPGGGGVAGAGGDDAGADGSNVDSNGGGSGFTFPSTFPVQFQPLRTLEEEKLRRWQQEKALRLYQLKEEFDNLMQTLNENERTRNAFSFQLTALRLQQQPVNDVEMRKLKRTCDTYTEEIRNLELRLQTLQEQYVLLYSANTQEEFVIDGSGTYGSAAAPPPPPAEEAASPPPPPAAGGIDPADAGGAPVEEAAFVVAAFPDPSDRRVSSALRRLLGAVPPSTQ